MSAPLRATVSGRAPSAASSRALAAPIPRVPPVITQSLPSSPSSMGPGMIAE